ncbi:MAG TPA: MBL fold metallo-hydrolase [Actinocrinis sp.]|jgi:ribonuclease J
MASIEFWGGVGVIGSSKVLVRDGEHRVLLDLGLDIPSGGDLLRGPGAPRPGRGLADRLALGGAPRIPGLFAPAALEGVRGFDGPAAFDPDGRLAEPAGPTAVFVTHPHIDHIGLTGFVREEIPVHASPDTARLMRALNAAGEGLEGGDPQWVEVPEGGRVGFGPIEVERVPVDHDVPGASGYLVRTGDGTLAFTGDLRFHGHHPERSRAFAERAAGCDVLVTEGTTLGWDEFHPSRTEADVEADFARLAAGTGDLLLCAVYPRDVERVERFLGIAAAAGRTLVWPDRTAAFLAGMGVEGVVAMSEVGLEGLRAAPGAYIVQFDADRFGDLLDLPIGPGTVFIHANGEPLGPFEPRWDLFARWLDRLGVKLERIGCSGHAYQDDLHEMVHRVGPKVLVPIHTFAPYRVHPVGSTARLVVEYAEAYDFTGRPVARVPAGA